MTDKTTHQILRFIDKVSEKFPSTPQPDTYTDIHIHASQDSGDLMAFDDEDREITRCVVDEWINNSSNPEVFYHTVEKQMRDILNSHNIDLGIIKPYSFVLENENGEHICELYVVDDSETMILGTPFMENLDKDLDDFITQLMND